MKTFKQYLEDVSVGGGAFGPAAATEHGGSVGNTDWYATGDTRLPVILGAKKTKGKKKILVQRRPLVNT